MLKLREGTPKDVPSAGEDKTGRLLKKHLGEEVALHVPLAPHTTFGLGGPADFFYQPQTLTEISRAIQFAREEGIPYYLMAGGSNLVVADRGFRGLVVKITCAELETGDHTISAQAGISLGKIVDTAYEMGWAGIETLAGIPGSFGGAIYGNAGAYGRSISDVLENAVVYDREGQVKIVGPEYFGFRYRHSDLKVTREVVLSARIRLVDGDRAKLKARMKEILATRHAKHPVDLGSAGSYFKNIEDPQAQFGKVPAGLLLDQVGAKNLRIGNAGVFRRHANIIVNYGGARTLDVRKLAEIMREKVKRAHRIVLEEEIQLVGDFDETPGGVPTAHAA